MGMPWYIYPHYHYNSHTQYLVPDEDDNLETAITETANAYYLDSQITENGIDRLRS